MNLEKTKLIWIKRRNIRACGERGIDEVIFTNINYNVLHHIIKYVHLNRDVSNEKPIQFSLVSLFISQSLLGDYRDDASITFLRLSPSYVLCG